MKKAIITENTDIEIKKGSSDENKVIAENINVPGHRMRVDRKKYEAMRQALMKILPKKPPGKTQREMFEEVKKHLSEELFPGGAKSGWWVKTVQLDLEAKQVIKRSTESKPLRWYRE